VPKTELALKGDPTRNPVIGVWSTTSRQRVEVVLPDTAVRMRQAGLKERSVFTHARDVLATGYVWHAALVPGLTRGEVAMTIQVRTRPERRWAAGAEVRLGPDAFLLRPPVDERTAADRSWVWREATAEVPGWSERRVRLRQVALRRLGRRGAQLRDGLGVQADLLSIVAGDRGLPRLVGRHDEAGRTTLVTQLPAAPSWRDGFGPSGAALDRLTAAAALAAAVSLCTALAELHRHGAAHRALGPDAILLLDRYRTAVPRDLGLAGFRPEPGEGPGIYRAPEQHRPADAGRPPGPATDVYQLAALIYHTLTGRRPGPAPNPPVRAAVAGFPAGPDGVIAAALAAAPALRPEGMAPLADALRTARAVLGGNQVPGAPTAAGGSGCVGVFVPGRPTAAARKWAVRRGR